MTPDQFTALHRARQLGIRDLVVDAVARRWPVLDVDHLDDTYPALARDVLAVAVAAASTSAAVSAQYARVLRAASTRTGATPRITPAPLDVQALTTSLHVEAVAMVVVDTAADLDPVTAMTAALTRVQGQTARHVLDAGRHTVIAAVQDDDRALGYRRVLGRGGCTYCRDRAAEPPTREPAFHSHPHCGCTGAPVYRA